MIFSNDCLEFSLKISESFFFCLHILLEERIILLTGTIDDAMASSIIGQLLYLEAQDNKNDIYMYINSPGGSVSAGIAIFDTMNFVSCDVSTICCGMAASMASIF